MSKIIGVMFQIALRKHVNDVATRQWLLKGCCKWRVLAESEKIFK